MTPMTRWMVPGLLVLALAFALAGSAAEHQVGDGAVAVVDDGDLFGSVICALHVRREGDSVDGTSAGHRCSALKNEVPGQVFDP